MEKERVIGKIDHVVIAVWDVEKAKEFFSDLLDTEFIDQGVYEPTGFHTLISHEGLELIGPSRPDADVAKFLEKRGEGLYALAFTVEDGNKARAKAEKKGIRVVGDVGSEEWGFREIWLHPKDNFGVYIMFTKGNPHRTSEV